MNIILTTNWEYPHHWVARQRTWPDIWSPDPAVEQAARSRLADIAFQPDDTACPRSQTSRSTSLGCHGNFLSGVLLSIFSTHWMDRRLCVHLARQAQSEHWGMPTGHPHASTRIDRRYRFETVLVQSSPLSAHHQNQYNNFVLNFISRTSSMFWSKH